MRLLARFSILLALSGLGIGLLALQGGYDQYGRGGFQRGGRSNYYGDAGNEKAEYYWSRLRYTPSHSYGGYGFYGRGMWSQDYPKADRQFLIALTRLTRIQTRSTEQVVGLDPDDDPPIENF